MSNLENETKIVAIPVMTEKDQEITRECYMEAFWFRCVPLVTVNSILVHLLYKRGVLKRPFISVSVASLASYVLGVASYKGACEKKFAEKAPDTDFSRVYRRIITGEELAKEKRQKQLADKYEAPPSYLRELGKDESVFRTEEIQEEQKPLTYDELRRRNRAQYDHKSSSPSYTPPSKLDTPNSFINLDDGKRNKYGDSWDRND